MLSVVHDALLSLLQFMTLCKRIDPSDDMKTILENKFMKHVKGCSNEFLQSQKYKHLLKDHIKKITDDPRNVYVYISDFLKELKARKVRDVFCL